MDAIARNAHFYRRAGFGGTIDDIYSRSKTEDRLSAWLQSPPSISVPGLGAALDPKQRGQQVRQFGEWLLQQMGSSANPLHERITNFWRDRFVVAIQKIRFPQLLTDYETRLRSYALGDFQDLLWQVTTSPAMLSYLDNDRNRRGNINENFSREVMELFTIGRGQYSERDIQEGARALTGWVITPNRATGAVTSSFVPRRHDSAIKTYLGKRGAWKTEDVVEILANHPATARNLATQLWSTFVYPNPEPAIVQRLAELYVSRQRNVGAVVEAMFRSPEFFSPRAYRCRVKSPLFFMVGTMRQLQIRADPLKVLGSLRAMGQIPYNAPTVKG